MPSETYTAGVLAGLDAAERIAREMPIQVRLQAEVEGKPPSGAVHDLLCKVCDSVADRIKLARLQADVADRSQHAGRLADATARRTVAAERGGGHV